MKVVRVTVKVAEEPGAVHPTALGAHLKAVCYGLPGITEADVELEVYDPRDREAVGEGP